MPTDGDKMNVFGTILILISMVEFSSAVNRIRQTAEKPARPSVTSDTVYFEEGDTVTLTCNSTAPNVTNFEWKRYQWDLIPGVNSQIYVFLANYVYGWNHYACRVYVGTVASDWSTIQLWFQPRRSTLTSSVQGTVKKGASVTLTCTTPSPGLYFYPSFYRDGNLVHREFDINTYTINDLTTEDTGTYTCNHYYDSAIASDISEPLWMLVVAVNRIRPTAEKPARPSVTSDTVYFEEGDTVTLTCNSTAPNVTNFEWKRYQWDLIPGVNSQIYVFLANYVYGWNHYACRIYVGTVASDWSTIQLWIQPRQSTLTSSGQGTVKKGASVTLTCTTPSPGLYFYPSFYRDGNLVHREFDINTYTINDLTTEDTGTYTCNHYYDSAIASDISEPLWMLVVGDNEARIDDAYQPLQYEGKMYYINQDSFTDYQDAMDRCQFEGGILAEINDEDEFFTIQNYLNNVMHNFSYVYIGGTDMANEGDWVLRTTNQALPYTNWHMYHPLQSDKANCLSLTSFSNWEMFSFVCSFGSPNPAVYYLCEKEQVFM